MRHKHSAPGDHEDETPAAAPAAAIALPPLPALGDPDKRFGVELSEPEINAIHQVYGYIAGQVLMLQQYSDMGRAGELFAAHVARWWNQYGPVIEALSTRLKDLK